MPPSPSWRCSPGREQKMDNTHKRGRSLEIGLIPRAKDDDLALFNDMQNTERENFLLHTADDVDDSLSKLRYHSDFKLGITIPARGESNDLLNADGEKNDYDWLLTPPDTPLFPSLDDEEPQLQNLLPRGRPRSLPINISRSSSNNGNTHRNSRSSASPCRLSPSPRSSNTTGQLVSRPASAPRSSPPPVVRSGTPSRRPSTPNRPSTPTLRSSTPTLRRMSTGSSGQASSSGRTGTSPTRASRGNSASPKLHGWQSNLPGFPFEAPPNLRTSVSDRPSTHVRGLSPTPRSGRGRHSMSPASRSVSSAHSNDRELFSSYSKGSVVSSGDDDVDSLHFVAISSSPPARRNGMPVNSRTMAFSKKPSKTSPSNSVPKRSFDSVLRQMDHRKTPQNMFRPLLSSVPSTTFYVGKANSTHRPMFSRNSSLTTSTSASSDQGASVAPDTEVSEHDQNDLHGEWERTPDPDNHEEMFIFEKVDDIIRDSGQELHAGATHSGAGSFDTDRPNKVNAIESEESVVNLGDVECLGVTTENTHAAGGLSVVDGCEIMAVCSKCGKKFSLLGVIGRTDVCQECIEIDGLIATRESSLSPSRPKNQTLKTEITIGRDATVEDVHRRIGVPELPERSCGEVTIGLHENNTEKGLNCPENSYVHSVMDDLEPPLSDRQLDYTHDVSSTQSDCGTKFVQKEHTAHPGNRVDNPEGTGISVLLQQRSSNSKWSVVQSRVFSATNILCAEPSYVRDNTSAMRRGLGRDCAFTSSSVDMESSRQMDDHCQHQISSRKMEVGNVRINTDVKSQCSGSQSDLAINAYELSSLSKNVTEGIFNHSTSGEEIDDLQAAVSGKLDNSLDQTDMIAANFSTCRADFVDSDCHINADCFVVKNTADSQLMSHMERCHYETSTRDNLNAGCPACITAKEYPLAENDDSSLVVKAPSNIPDSFIIAEQSVLNGPACRSDLADPATHNFDVLILESENNQDSFQDHYTDCRPSEKPNKEEHEHSVSSTLEKDATVSGLEPDLDDHAHGIHEESTVIVEGPGGHMSRSFTLAEATDTILFCSSIIHDIAYRAATIGMDELVVRPEASRPMITIVGKSVNEQKDSRKMPSKHTQKSQKFRRKKLETPTKTPLTESGNNVIVHGSDPPANTEDTPKPPDSIKPPKLESKCNCAVM